jgi:hypothetical protein
MPSLGVRSPLLWGMKNRLEYHKPSKAMIKTYRVKLILKYFSESNKLSSVISLNNYLTKHITAHSCHFGHPSREIFKVHFNPSKPQQQHYGSIFPLFPKIMKSFIFYNKLTFFKVPIKVIYWFKIAKATIWIKLVGRN